MEIKAGDVVRLKTGGPMMTVKLAIPRRAGSVADDRVMDLTCQWFDGTVLHEGEFSVESMEKLAQP